MKVILIILCIFFSDISKAQDKNSMIGEWQFFSEEGMYHELTISDSFVYTYTYLRTPSRRKYIIKSDTLLFEKDSVYFGTIDKWVLKSQNDSVYKLDATEFSTFLFRKEDGSSSVRSLYDITKGEYRQETFLFEKEVQLRIKYLEGKLKDL